ncbi:unnamed protein product [Vitrella brassicaformis CCMP3155]|uniref:Uncharacterized protein n=2 Tax=Vitrella brassicaformis TaxID=1169539 RepID=A0A0G4FPY2_VITBC|nr:unnamed protein product [Vitrella brassicaformis CCMP3155]|eukprot:CEM15844.1 unnamed protein product [Vitrella brassicaformis CCMP3155]
MFLCGRWCGRAATAPHAASSSSSRPTQRGSHADHSGRSAAAAATRGGRRHSHSHSHRPPAVLLAVESERHDLLGFLPLDEDDLDVVDGSGEAALDAAGDDRRGAQEPLSDEDGIDPVSETMLLDMEDDHPAPFATTPCSPPCTRQPQPPNHHQHLHHHLSVSSPCARSAAGGGGGGGGPVVIELEALPSHHSDPPACETPPSCTNKKASQQHSRGERGGGGQAQSARRRHSYTYTPMSMSGDALDLQQQAQPNSSPALSAREGPVSKPDSENHPGGASGRRLGAPPPKKRRFRVRMASLPSPGGRHTEQPDNCVKRTKQSGEPVVRSAFAVPFKVSRSLRVLVSKRKRRLVWTDYDLDLSYITSRVIAMGFPAIGIEALFRNPRRQVRKYLDHQHGDSYRVVNLCSESERQYPCKTFDGRLVCYPFKDHTPPPIKMMLSFCEDSVEWLKESKENVLAVHCKAGKGRTGVMVSALLLYTRACANPDAALRLYAKARTIDGRGVTIPSQRRFVHHFAALITPAPTLPMPILGNPLTDTHSPLIKLTRIRLGPWSLSYRSLIDRLVLWLVIEKRDGSVVMQSSDAPGRLRTRKTGEWNACYVELIFESAVCVDNDFVIRVKDTRSTHFKLAAWICTHFMRRVSHQSLSLPAAGSPTDTQAPAPSPAHANHPTNSTSGNPIEVEMCDFTSKNKNKSRGGGGPHAGHDGIDRTENDSENGGDTAGAGAVADNEAEAYENDCGGSGGGGDGGSWSDVASPVTKHSLRGMGSRSPSRVPLLQPDAMPAYDLCARIEKHQLDKLSKDKSDRHAPPHFAMEVFAVNLTPTPTPSPNEADKADYSNGNGNGVEALNDVVDGVTP